MAANYYEILNVQKDASNNVICEAYKKMALKWHPDKNPDNVAEANQRFQQISQAYQVLSDEHKRLKYDNSHMDYHDFSDDEDDEYDGSFFEFVKAEVLFRHIFEQFEQRAFRRYFNEQRYDKRNPRKCNGKGADDRRKEKDCDRRKEKDCDEDREEKCHTRMVNGKQWMTKTYYENDVKIVARYEDGELISKQINGVF